MQTLPVRELICRVRRGEAGPSVCVGAAKGNRVRMRFDRLRRLMDSVDVSQSVLYSFFVSVSLGRCEIEQPAQLHNLPVRTARNKLADHLRRYHALRRDLRKAKPLEIAERSGALPSDARLSASDTVALEELVGKFRSRLTTDERWLADQHRAGRKWTEIAAKRGVSAEALGKRLVRGIEQVASELDMDLSHA